MMSHQRAQRDAQVLVSTGLPTVKYRALRKHLRGCDDCMSHYERLRGVEDALAPAGEPMAPQAFERLGELVLDEAAPASSRKALGWLGAFSTAAALAVVMVLVVPRKSDDFGARGVSTSVRDTGLTLFVITPASGEVRRATIGADRRVSVPASQVMQLAYRNSAHRYGVVVGLDGRGELQWYHPGEAERGSGGVRLVTGAAEEPFPGAWNLDDVASPLRLFVIFADTPIDNAAVVVAVERWRAAGGAAETLTGIEGDQETLLIDVTKR